MKIQQIIDKVKEEYEHSDLEGFRAAELTALTMLAEIERWLSEGATLKASSTDGFAFEIDTNGNATASITVTGAKIGHIIRAKL